MILMAAIDWKSQQGKDFVEAVVIEADLKRLVHAAQRISSNGKFLVDLLSKAQAEANAIQWLIENPLKCDCSCEVGKHGSNGCKSWFGDRNTGFGCDCSWNGVTT